MKKKYHELDDEDLARICHEAHLALRIGLNDSAEDMHWDALPGKRKDLVTGEVRAFREGKTPAEVHQLWADTMRADGWRHGAARNFILKTHPDLVPYSELPPEGQAKVRQAQRIVFTHVMPSALEEVAYSDIRSRPGADEAVIAEDLPEVCVTHRHFYPCGGVDCVFSSEPAEVDSVYRERYE
jgi:RyR domain